MSTIERNGPSGVRDRLSEDFDVEDFRQQVSVTTTPLPVLDDEAQARLSRSAAVTPESPRLD